MSFHLYRLARWCFRRRGVVLALWLVAVAAVVTVAQLAGGKTTDTFSIPGTESQRVVSLLEQKLPAASGASTQVVFAGKGAVTSAQDRQAISAAVERLGTLPQVESVSNPFQARTISPDGKLALATVTYDTTAGKVEQSTIDKLSPTVSAARDAGLQVEFSGEVYPRGSTMESAEAIGIAVALIVLVMTFGSFVAGGLPIVTALFGVAVSFMSMMALASVVDIASAATTVGIMLGISCGIDYALFILSRYRTNRLAGQDPVEAVGRAAGTAGSSVVFAGLSVIIGLCGLTVAGIPFLTTMGLAGAGAVLMALLIALTLLPAALGFAGDRVIRFSRLPGLRRAEAATQAAVEHPERLAGTRWASWVVKRRVPVLIAGVLGLAILAVPVASMDLGLPGANSRPESDTSRRAYDLTTKHFGPGYNGTLTVVADGVSDPAVAAGLATTLGREDGVAAARPGVVTNGIALVTVVPTTGPNNPKTTDLVNRIRADRAEIAGDTGAKLLVGGQTAADIDVSAKLGDALPIFIVVVAGLAFVLLTFAFRTILVPIKSIIGFLLSAGAAFGTQVAVFQWGWASDLFGVEPSQTLSFLPIILIAIIFGLSSDYEVFVVSRIKEHFTKHGDARQAVVIGTGQSARVVTAAALIMAAVFAAFILGDDPIIKSIGFSFAVGVLVDAFVVRLTLVPAVMAIVGARIWHHPRWYGRHVPDPDIEGEKLDERLRAHGIADHEPAPLG